MMLKHYRAIEALLRCPTLKQAAQRAGVSERSLRRWRDDPHFMEAYRIAKQEAMERAIALMHGAAAVAAAVLIRNLACDKPAVEIKAAAEILKQAIGASVDEGLEAIERKLKLR